MNIQIIYFYNTVVYENKIIIVEIIIVSICCERGIRYSIHLVFFQIIYLFGLSLPFNRFCRKIRTETTSQLINSFRIRKFDCFRVWMLKKFVLMNENCVKTFYTYSVSIHIFVNCALITGLMINEYEEFLKFLFCSIIICEFCIIDLAVQLWIQLSSCLTKPVPVIFRMLNRCNYNGKGIDRLKSSLYYERIHTKRPFKFQLGVFSISRRSFLTAFLFYSSELLFFIGSVRENKKIE